MYSKVCNSVNERNEALAMKKTTIANIARLGILLTFFMALGNSSTKGQHELSWYTIDGGGG